MGGGGGGRKRLCARSAHVPAQNAKFQGSLKGPGRSRTLGF